MVRLALHDVTRRFPGAVHPVLDRLDLEVHDEEILVVLGSSGAGKSTLVRLLAGLEEPQSGTIDRGEDTRRPALVPQSPDLLPWLSVRENVALGGRYAANAEHFRPERVSELLADLGIAELASAIPSELSGGQAQRVALGRALAVDPGVVLLDEPFSALDPMIRGELQVWLREILTRVRTASVLVTHDVDEAIAIGDRIVYLDGARGITATWRPREDGTRREEILDRYRSSGPRDAREQSRAPRGTDSSGTEVPRPDVAEVIR